jgi:Succinylglutamate desuccinylase / Aspartoacylase family
MSSSNHYPIDISPPNLKPLVQGNSNTPYVFDFAAALPGPTVLLCALTHGNEYSGAIVLKELLDLQFRPRRGRLIIIFNNVAAFDTFNSDQPDHSRFVDEDFNRVWSVDTLEGNRQSVELNRARQIRPFIDQADFLLDLHSMHETAPAMFVCGLLPKNVTFGQTIGAPQYLMCDVGHAQGVRMRDYRQFSDAKLAAQAVLLEAGQHWEQASVNCARDVTARTLIKTHVADRDDFPKQWLQPDGPAQKTIVVSSAVTPLGDSFTFAKPFKGFETLPLNELIATETVPISGDYPKGMREIRAPYNDCVLVMPSTRYCAPGVTVVRLGKTMP